MSGAHDYATHHADSFEQQLIDLLRIPSVSTLPQHAPDVERAANWLADDLRRVGLSHVELFQQPGKLPLVYGAWSGAGPDAPTILIYGHYDVQPAEMADGWHSDPFTPVVREGRLYARGAVDSKSHVIAQLKAVEALLATDCPANIKLLFEGEEESGSEHIFDFVAANHDLLAADVVVVSDGSLPEPDQPVLVYGLRGLVTLEVEVTGPARDLHSGHFGGTVHNPIQALAEIISKLHDEQTGTVTVPGFYDDVRPVISDAAAARLAQIEWDAVTGAPRPWGEPEFALNERIGARPTLEFNGIRGGFAGEGFKTVLPAQALAKISCRLVPDQDPDLIFEQIRDHILRLTPPTVTVAVRLLEPGVRGILIDPTDPAVQVAARAYEQAWGVKPILTREGGSIPVVAQFQAELGAPVALMPFGYKGGGAHGPNEYVILEMFHKGIAAAIHFVQDYAAQHRHA